MYYGLEKRCRRKECTSVPKRPQQSRADSRADLRADSPVASAVASDTAAGLSSGPSGANGKSVMPPRGRVQPCVRPIDVAPMAAGPDEVRGSDPNPLQRAQSAWTPRGSCDLASDSAQLIDDAVQRDRSNLLDGRLLDGMLRSMTSSWRDDGIAEGRPPITSTTIMRNGSYRPQRLYGIRRALNGHLRR